MDKKTASIARGEKPAEKVFKNARVLDVFNKTFTTTSIAVEKGVIMGVGEYKGKKEIDLGGRYLAPGLIDGHVHIESSMVTPAQFGNIILPMGTTTIIADPHEIANVKGKEGIRFMLESAKETPLDVFMMIPSSVPATRFETAGAEITPEDVASLLEEEGVFGLGEVMNYPDVLAAEDDIMKKIALAKGRIIDGHAPGVKAKDLNTYILAGVMTDHECSSAEELQERVARGMYVHLREGSATKNVKDLLRAVTEANVSRVLFCTDDKHPEDIRAEGHINKNVNIAIDAGFSAATALTMATLNAAECYRLHDRGAIAPGRKADFIVFKSLRRIEPEEVYKDGELVALDRHPVQAAKITRSQRVIDTVNIDADRLDFTLPPLQGKMRIIGLVPGNITTRHIIAEVTEKDGRYRDEEGGELLKAAVIERHKNTGNIGIGLVKGYGMRGGALAMTIAHDSHNLVVIGDDDEAMHLAAKEMKRIQGGIVLVKEGRVEDALPLEIAGIMTAEEPAKVAKTLERMKTKIRAMGLSKKIADPFVPLSFLSLPVIPELKLTDLGLFDVEKFQHVDITFKERKED